MKTESIQRTAFVLSSVLFGLIARQWIVSGIVASGLHLYKTCHQSPIVFTHYAPLDEFLCILKVFFRRAMDDYMGLHITRVILGLFGTVQVIMALEGSRYGYSKWYHITSWLMFWGMAANVFTIAVISSVCWVPLLVLSSYSFLSQTKQPSKNNPQHDQTVPVMIQPSRVYAIFYSILITYGLPSLFMTTSIIAPPSTWLSDQIIVFWQFAPVFYHLLYLFLTMIFNKSSFLKPYFYDQRVQPLHDKTEKEDEDINGPNQVRQRVRMAQSKAAVEKVYLLLASINLFIYYGSFFKAQSDGVYIKDSLILLFLKQIPVMGLNETQITQFLSAHVLLLDLLVTTITFSVWALYEDGLYAFLFVSLGNIVLGPGTSVALYAAYRELRIQNPENLKLRIKKQN
ncbi:unnamed protein product [Cunninghamella echinulata]